MNKRVISVIAATALFGTIAIFTGCGGSSSSGSSTPVYSTVGSPITALSGFIPTVASISLPSATAITVNGSVVVLQDANSIINIDFKDPTKPAVTSPTGTVASVTVVDPSTVPLDQRTIFTKYVKIVYGGNAIYLKIAIDDGKKSSPITALAGFTPSAATVYSNAAIVTVTGSAVSLKDATTTINIDFKDPTMPVVTSPTGIVTSVVVVDPSTVPLDQRTIFTKYVKIANGNNTVYLKITIDDGKSSTTSTTSSTGSTSTSGSTTSTTSSTGSTSTSGSTTSTSSSSSSSSTSTSSTSTSSSTGSPLPSTSTSTTSSTSSTSTSSTSTSGSSTSTSSTTSGNDKPPAPPGASTTSTSTSSTSTSGSNIDTPPAPPAF